MCDHEHRASPPLLRNGVSAPSGHYELDVSGETDIATKDRVGHGNPGGDDAAAAYASLVAALSTTLPARPDAMASGSSQHELRREACATAVADDRERIARDLYDTVIHRLFGAGLQLQATCQLVDGAAQARIEATIELLDATITELRKAIFSLH